MGKQLSKQVNIKDKLYEKPAEETVDDSGSSSGSYYTESESESSESEEGKQIANYCFSLV